MRHYQLLFVLFLVSISSIGCKQSPKYQWREMTVTATAYNSVVNQTSQNPYITAFGDSLIPGLNYIAVSRDLLDKGLKHNTLVHIDGLDGEYVVKDKMNKRYKDHIDIYMGLDIEAAKKWGRQTLKIQYRIKVSDTVKSNY